MHRTRSICALAVAALLMAGCGGDDDDASNGDDSSDQDGGTTEEDASSEAGTPAEIEPLDPDEWHYGGRYADWAGDWWRWLNEMVPAGGIEECGEPVGDTTGELCTLGQDPDSEVFYLAGTWGSTVTRTECVVPEGKALFFPLVSSSTDNGGVPKENWETDEQLQTRLQADFENIPTGELLLSIDDREIVDLERFAVENAPYEFTLPDSPNMYDCLGVEGVTGTYSGFASGYFVLLAPLPAGEHVLEFGGTVETGGDPFVTQARYDPLTIE
jgi:hypothetical protein